jgi:hypothetical protein
VLVEADKPLGDGRYFRAAESVGEDGAVEHVIPWEASHDDQPVNRTPFPVYREASVIVPSQRRHAEIDILRQTTVESKLLATVLFTRFDRPKVEK